MERAGRTTRDGARGRCRGRAWVALAATAGLLVGCGGGPAPEPSAASLPGAGSSTSPSAGATRLVTRTVATGPAVSGRASSYSRQLQGRPTTSGEAYDERRLTAASRTLPLGSLVRVCRGARCLVVRVNDRGPHDGRLMLDLSGAAAKGLGLGDLGTVTATPVREVRVRVPS